MITQFIALVFASLLIAGAVSDASRYKISNWLSGALLLPFVLAIAVNFPGWTGLGLHLATGFVALVLGMAIFAAGWWGGGDAKMFAAASFMFGWPLGYHFLFYTALAGGGLVLVLIASRHLLPAIPVMARHTPGTALAQGAPVPYGIAIAIAGLILLPRVDLLTTF